MVVEIFITVFVLIFLAELVDKTELAILSMALHFKDKVKVFMGAWLSHVLLDGIAILLGVEFTKFIQIDAVKIIFGTIFMVIGAHTFIHRNRHDGGKMKLGNRAFMATFLAVSASEFGDKSQVASAVLGGIYNQDPFIVFLGAITALAVVIYLNVFVGSKLARKLPKKEITALSGILFFIFGVLFIVY
jgi:putative Ca2+/H+ antiporter (TMEM165/GDT1 family)